MSLKKKWIKKEINQLSEIAGFLWERGWAERNGGNISINLSDKLKDISFDEKTPFIAEKLPAESAEMIFLVTGTGCYIRTLISSPKKGACILKINNDASGYNIIWGGKSKNFRPTSEFISHLKIHIDLVKRNSPYRAIVHTHPTEILVLSHNSEMTKNETLFNKTLWSMSPETRVFVPRGVALTSYSLPGGEELADLTVKDLQKKDVSIWLKHGALAAGETVVDAFDFLDVTNKAAQMWLMAKSAGFDPVGLSDEELKGLEVYL